MGSIWTAGAWLGEAAAAPLGWLPQPWGLMALSAVLGVVLLLAFRLLTPQRRLRLVKDQMSACVYELRLFSASPFIVMWAQGRAIKFTAIYLMLAMPSLAALAPVMGAVASRLALRYEVRPLRKGEQVLVTFVLDGATTRPVVRAAGKGLRVIPPLVMVQGDGGAEGYVRVRAVAAGEHQLSIRVGSATASKTVQVDTGGGPVSWRRARADDASTLLSREPALPETGPVTAITVDYPRREPLWPGLPWWTHLLVISMAAAFALRRRLGVVF